MQGRTENGDENEDEDESEGWDPVRRNDQRLGDPSPERPVLEMRSNRDSEGHPGGVGGLREDRDFHGRGSSQEKTRRLAEVADAIVRAAAEDRAKLEAHLERLRQVDEKQGNLLPGEIPERALRLARATRPEFTQVLLAELVAAKIQRTRRQLLIEALGRKGDVLQGIRAPGEDQVERTLRAPDLVREALRAASVARDRAAADEVAAWIRAGSRLVARASGSLEDLGNLAEEVSRAFGDAGPVAAEATRVARAESTPGDEADTLAAGVKERSRYTRLLLELATAVPEGCKRS